MSNDGQPAESERPPDDDCPLPLHQQRRNILLYGALWALYYLSAPITYVGITHAHILSKLLGTSDFLANLPASAYLWVTALGAIAVAWLFPDPRLAKTLLISGLIGIAVMSGLVAAAFSMQLPKNVWIGMVIAHGFVLGICSGISFPAMWDILRRGVASSRRGVVMGLAFGLGPVFACVGSLLQQLILHGKALGVSVGPVEFPGNCVLLFGAFAPVMLLGAICSAAFIVPDAAAGTAEVPRAADYVNGLREFVGSRPVFLGVVCYVLAYSGQSVMQTVSLDASKKSASSTADRSANEAAAGQNSESVADGDVSERRGAAAKGADRSGTPKGEEEEKGTTGYQNLLRFGFKAVAGVLLGWLLARTNPRAGILATTSILIAGVLWALWITGRWYIISMGVLGAGELFGTYFPNYVVSASRKRRVRLNVAFLSFISALVGFAPILFGLIADWTKRREPSMWVAVGILVLTIAIILVWLPKDPRPVEPAEDAVLR